MLKDLLCDALYYWRVRSITPEGKFSDYSMEGTFITSKLSGVAMHKEGLIPKEFALQQNYPKVLKVNGKVMCSKLVANLATDRINWTSEASKTAYKCGY